MICVFLINLNINFKIKFVVNGLNVFLVIVKKEYICMLIYV